jgi:co-chaperonin GroES (HSP10)
MKPLRDLVLIEVDKQPERVGSLAIVEEWKTLPATGVIKAVGPDVKSVKISDKVMFERYASVILNEDERLCQESNILGIYESL